MKKPQKKSVFLFIGIILILIPVLYKRLYIKNYPIESTYSYLAGVATVLIPFMIYKLYLKNKK